MKDIIKKVEHYRLIRLSLFFLVFIFCTLGIVLSQVYINNDWLSSLLLFDCLLMFVVTVYLIERSIGTHYHILYHKKLIPRILKNIQKDMTYDATPKDNTAVLQETHIFNDDSDIKVYHVLKTKAYQLMDVSIYLKSYRHKKINQFKGYIVELNCSKGENNILLLYKKTPLTGNYEEIIALNFFGYRLFAQSNETINDGLYDGIRSFLKSYYKKKQKFHISIAQHAYLFEKNKKSIFRKPFFKKVNQRYMYKKTKDFEMIIKKMQRFYECIK